MYQFKMEPSDLMATECCAPPAHATAVNPPPVGVHPPAEKDKLESERAAERRGKLLHEAPIIEACKDAEIEVKEGKPATIAAMKRLITVRQLAVRTSLQRSALVSALLRALGGAPEAPASGPAAVPSVVPPAPVAVPARPVPADEPPVFARVVEPSPPPVPARAALDPSPSPARVRQYSY